jgi:hypothetical protein
MSADAVIDPESRGSHLPAPLRSNPRPSLINSALIIPALNNVVLEEVSLSCPW